MYPVTSNDDASVSCTTADALTRWNAEVQPIRCMVALGVSERVRLEAATTGKVRDAVRADAAA